MAYIGDINAFADSKMGIRFEKYIECPNCGAAVAINNKSVGVICSGCDKFFSTEGAKDISTPNKSSAVHGNETQVRKIFRESMEHQAQDSVDGIKRGGSYYNYRRLREIAARRGLNV